MCVRLHCTCNGSKTKHSSAHFPVVNSKRDKTVLHSCWIGRRLTIWAHHRQRPDTHGHAQIQRRLLQRQKRVVVRLPRPPRHRNAGTHVPRRRRTKGRRGRGQRNRRIDCAENKLDCRKKIRRSRARVIIRASREGVDTCTWLIYPDDKIAPLFLA